MDESLEWVRRILLPDAPPVIPSYRLTKPTAKLLGIECDDDCDNCPLYLKGCAGICNRFPDKVCKGCPCRASKFVGNVNCE